jgi:hypothetical protein
MEARDVAGHPTRELDYATPSFLSGYNSPGVSGPPTYFTIEGSALKVALLDDTDLELLYSQKLPALSVSNTSNWMLADNPDAYLYGSLTMAATLTEDATNGGAWNQLTADILGEIWSLDFATRGTSAQRTSGPTP